MSKYEIIKSIINFENERERSMNSILSVAILNACKDELGKSVNIEDLQVKVKSLSYLIDQIQFHEFNLKYIKSLEDPTRHQFEQIEILERYISGYYENINKILQEL